MKTEYNLDENIAELVWLFNQYGFNTIYSCEGHYPNKPYILFHVEDEDKINQFIKSIYNIYNKDKDHIGYVDIGEFIKLFTPVVELTGFDQFLYFNNNYFWEGKYWVKEDYKQKINKFIELIKQMNF